MQTDGVQRDPARAHVLVRAQQVSATIGAHAVALAEVAIGIGQCQVGTGDRLGSEDPATRQLAALVGQCERVVRELRDQVERGRAMEDYG